MSFEAVVFTDTKKVWKSENWEVLVRNFALLFSVAEGKRWSAEEDRHEVQYRQFICTTRKGKVWNRLALHCICCF